MGSFSYVKRTLDVIAASLGLAGLSPLLAILAVLVKATSAGPVFFRQERMGKDFRPFQILKFRSMTCERSGEGRLITCAGDSRVTPIGRILRKAKLDELPQLINVVRGDMSLVGPRPEVRRYVDMFREDYREILQVRPGMTDLASIKFRDEEAVLGGASDPEKEYVTRILPEKIRLAKQYVRQASFLMDFRILWSTLLSVLVGGKPPVEERGNCAASGSPRP
jgi:lipopolysaccharide/colanic/teichoic acid biosynthesis glycosyltransferase